MKNIKNIPLIDLCPKDVCELYEYDETKIIKHELQTCFKLKDQGIDVIATDQMCSVKVDLLISQKQTDLLEICMEDIYDFAIEKYGEDVADIINEKLLQQEEL